MRDFQKTAANPKICKIQPFSGKHAPKVWAE